MADAVSLDDFGGGRGGYNIILVNKQERGVWTSTWLGGLRDGVGRSGVFGGLRERRLGAMVRVC